MCITPIEESSGNVYADLGLAHAQEMLVKAKLVGKISDIIKHQNLTQQQAAQLLALPQPKVSKMLRGQFRGIGAPELLDCLALLGGDVDLVVKPAHRTTKANANGSSGRANVEYP